MSKCPNCRNRGWFSTDMMGSSFFPCGLCNTYEQCEDGINVRKKITDKTEVKLGTLEQEIKDLKFKVDRLFAALEFNVASNEMATDLDRLRGYEALVYRYIDRMNDPAECDLLHDIVAEFVTDFEELWAVESKPENNTLQHLLQMTVPVGPGCVMPEDTRMSPEFRIAVQEVTEDGIRIIIHANGHDSETLDRWVVGDDLLTLDQFEHISSLSVE